MDNAVIIREVKNLTRRSGRAAEDYLLSIADRHGDEALTPILAGLSPLDWAGIIRSETAGIPSALIDLLSPQQIALATQAEPVFWKEEVKNLKTEDVVTAVTEMLYAILSSVGTTRRLEILDAIQELDGGIFFLSIPFWDLHPDTEHEEDDEDATEASEAQTATAVDLDLDTENELFELIRESSPLVAERIISIVQDPGLQMPEGNVYILLRSIHEALYHADASITSDERQEAITQKSTAEDMFLPV